MINGLIDFIKDLAIVITFLGFYFWNITLKNKINVLEKRFKR